MVAKTIRVPFAARGEDTARGGLASARRRRMPRRLRPGMRVEILDPERTLSNRSEAGDWVWTFVLVPEDDSTRLISRNRIAMTGAAAGQRLGMLVMESGSLVMERRMLLGIKERAERSVRQR